MVPVDSGASPTPIDRPILERMQSRFSGSRLAKSAAIVTERNVHLRMEVAEDYCPGTVSVRLEIRWYRNDDFSIHYQETRQESTWQCRWDRHPDAHNTRGHFHPPPAASRTDAEAPQWPADHRDVCQHVLDAIEDRIDTLWAQR